jgi:hypothetical protein
MNRRPEPVRLQRSGSAQTAGGTSVSNSRHSSACPANTATVPAVVPDVPAKLPAHPWVIGGIDYGPAIATLRDLCTWAFDLAARDVADWPEGQRRVRTARQLVIDRLCGKYSADRFGDVLFTASLLIRIFDDELHLGMSEMVAILDRLGLPTELVPLMPRRQASAPIHPPIAPITPLRPRPAAPAAAAAPAPHDDCDEHSQFCPRLRNAA